MVGAVQLLLLVVILHLEALVCQVLALSLEVLSSVGVIGEDTILMTPDALDIGVSSLIVELALVVFLILQVHLMPGHHSIVIIASPLYLISEFRVLLCNPNLLLQPLFFVMELSETIFQHLSLYLLLFHVKFLAELT